MITNSTSIGNDDTLERTITDPAMTTTHPSHSYLSYEPKPSIKGHCPNHFFDKIGFKSADASAQMRIAFIADMTTHFKSRSHKNLTRTKDPKAFKIVVSEFLAEFGSSYWGDSERDHLQESDPLKAFLCPRDARRENSRLIEVVEQFYNYKTYFIIRNAKKSKANRINHVSQASHFNKHRTPTRRPAFLAASAKINKESKRTHLSDSPRREQPYPDFEAFETPNPHDLTPPLTSTPEENPSNEKVFILSDDSDAGEGQRRRNPTTIPLGTSTKKNKGPVHETPRGFEEVKKEPLTGDMMKQTMFLVTIHDSPIGPVPVPFTECGNFHSLFPTLIEERGVPVEDVRKVDNITTIFTWTGGDFGGRIGGIRRNKPGDWDYFCDSLRKAHERDADRFNGRCEVAIKLHINDRHKEYC